MNREKTFRFVLAAILSALIIVMTVVPYTGYINYGGIEITTLHIVVILGAVALGWKYGLLLGTVWGVSCIVRCYVAFPVYLDFGFGNFFVACLPRMLVGVVAGLVFAAFKKGNKYIGAGTAAICGTLCNTVLVLSAMNIYSKIKADSVTDVYTVLKSILGTIVGVNGVIELAAAIILVPTLYSAVMKSRKKRI